MKLVKQLIFLSLFVPFMAFGVDSQIQVSTTGVGVCTIETTQASNIVFGNYSGQQTDASSEFSINCGSIAMGSIVKVYVNGGLNENSSERRMAYNGTEYLKYSLYTDSGRSTPWTINGFNSITLASGDNPVSIYARVAASEAYRNNATYTDTLTISWQF